jgi:hypothetical protein
VSPSSVRHRRLVPAALVMAALVLAGCGSGQGRAENYSQLEDGFIDGCEETLAADAEAGDGAEVPEDFCQCAFDALSEGDDAVDFDELMKVNDDLTEENAPLPDSVTEAFAACLPPA